MRFHDYSTYKRILDLFRTAATPSLERIRRDRADAPKRLEPLLEYLEKHLFDRSLNVHQMKMACGIRDNSVAILFHSQIGQTPKAYISSRRMETAARLLRGSDLKIWEISELVGYSGLGVFSKAFHRWAGQRPLSYRRQDDAGPHPSDLPIPSASADGEFLRSPLVGEAEAPDPELSLERLRQQL